MKCIFFCIAFFVASPFSFASVEKEIDVKPEQLSVRSLDLNGKGNLLWVSDFAFGLADGRFVLVDIDRGEMLGMLGTGLSPMGLHYSPDGSEIYAVETFFSRSSRGKRTDTVGVFDPRSMKNIAEIEIPPRSFHGIPTLGRSALTSNGRFLLVYNFTPTQTVSVIDVVGREFVTEIVTPGCAMVYSAGESGFFQWCADGSTLTIILDKDGKEKSRQQSKVLVDSQNDFVLENGIYANEKWYFLSLRGNIFEFDATSDVVKLIGVWPLSNELHEVEESRPLFEIPGSLSKRITWQAGGHQGLSLTPNAEKLYVLTRVGSRDSYEDVGTHVWVMDVKNRKKIKEIELKTHATSILVSGSDSHPLLYAMAEEAVMHGVDVYDGLTGKFIKNIPEIGITPYLLQRGR